MRGIEARDEELLNQSTELLDRSGDLEVEEDRTTEATNDRPLSHHSWGAYAEELMMYRELLSQETAEKAKSETPKAKEQVKNDPEPLSVYERLVKDDLL